MEYAPRNSRKLRTSPKPTVLVRIDLSAHTGKYKSFRKEGRESCKHSVMCPKVQQNGFIHNRDIFFLEQSPFDLIAVKNVSRLCVVITRGLHGSSDLAPSNFWAQFELSQAGLPSHRWKKWVTKRISGRIQSCWNFHIAGQTVVTGAWSLCVHKELQKEVLIREDWDVENKAPKKQCPVVPFKVQAMCINCSFQKRLASVLFLGLIKAQRLFRSVTI